MAAFFRHSKTNLDSREHKHIRRLSDCIGRRCNRIVLRNSHPKSGMGTADYTDYCSSRHCNRISPWMDDNFSLYFYHIHRPAHNSRHTYDRDKHDLHNTAPSNPLNTNNFHLMDYIWHRFYLNFKMKLNVLAIFCAVDHAKRRENHTYIYILQYNSNRMYD